MQAGAVIALIAGIVCIGWSLTVPMEQVDLPLMFGREVPPGARWLVPIAMGAAVIVDAVLLLTLSRAGLWLALAMGALDLIDAVLCGTLVWSLVVTVPLLIALFTLRDTFE